MNAPLPSFFRPPSTERDQTIMRPPNNDDFCLQVPNSSDYLIPLPGPRSEAVRLLSEATCVTLSESVTTSAMPRVTSPAIPKSLNNSGCWETSFMLPNSKSDQLLLSADHSSHNHHCNDGNNSIDDDKLISLDTPQQTPTLIKPPISFGDKESSSSNSSNNMLSSTITLDPANLNNKQGMSYANVHMVNSVKLPCGTSAGDSQQLPSPELMNGTVNVDKTPPPFTIQGFNERYKSNENHSEISC